LSGFSPEWLRLREPLDAASRDPGSSATLERDRGGVLEVVDLGAGTGANLRYLAPRLGGAQNWLLLDDDPRVLGAVETELSLWGKLQSAQLTGSGDDLVVHGAGFQCRVHRRRFDLAAQLNEIALPDHALVTASALLDLVSASWLQALAVRCRAARARLLFALTYDGRMMCSPSEPEDAMVSVLFNRHQTTDKGFGPALGPAAATTSARIFSELGYEVTARESDWRLQAGDRVLQTALVGGWMQAALDIAPQEEDTLRAWHHRRLEHIEHGRSALVVGHIDLTAWLPREGPNHG
jgi:hypothetical protein